MGTNALSNEKSPYLKQHANNPVDWLPWGEIAFEKARLENKPIFLSIGYSTCHWCHVMAHESFEDESVAQVLNQHFVPVKIDREERPDIDRVYMLFVQASTGSGGWPMSVWLTPELKPFYGGTYFPPDGAYGRPGFRTVLQHLADAWRNDRARIIESSESVTSQLDALSAQGKGLAIAGRELVTAAYNHFRRTFDSHYGGFGAAPKFPRPVGLNFLFRFATENAPQSEEAIQMATVTLRAMAAGGMHDHLGGGFHRYAVDERWFVPHFEKMLYDQAQLAIAYIEAFQVTSDSFFASVAEDILQYVMRDLISPEGCFYSAEDADSTDPENHALHGEGAFYIWRQREIEATLGVDAGPFCAYFGVQPNGNVEVDPQGEFRGRNILSVSGDIKRLPEFRESCRKLLAVRTARPRPHLDGKVLTSWNSLMISAFARAAGVLDNSAYLEAAINAANFLLEHNYNAESGRLLRRYVDGEAAIAAFADDYTFLAAALVDLFEVTGVPSYLQTAASLVTRGLKKFEDAKNGGFFSTENGASDVLLRLKDEYDGAEPSTNSVAIDVLLRLAHLTGNHEFQSMADRAISWLAAKVQSQPAVAPAGLAAIMRTFSPPSQVVVRCAEISAAATAFARTYRARFSPNVAVLLLPDASQKTLESIAPFLATLGRESRFTVYRCSNFACELPEQVA